MIKKTSSFFFSLKSFKNVVAKLFLSKTYSEWLLLGIWILIFLALIWSVFILIPEISLSEFLIEQQNAMTYNITIKNQIGFDATTTSTLNKGCEIPVKAHRIYHPHSLYERELIQRLYLSIDPTNAFSKVYDALSSNIRYAIYWYVSYHDVVRSNVPWTESTIHAQVLSLDTYYLSQIVDAFTEHYKGFTASWKPEENYLNAKLYHEWLAFGPKYVPALCEIVSEVELEQLTSVEGQKLINHFINTESYTQYAPRSKFQFEIFQKFKDSEYFSRLYSIFCSNERELVYWYATHYHEVWSRTPWNLVSIHTACLSLPPEMVVHIVDAGRASIDNFDYAWHPPDGYLRTRVWDPWLITAPDFIRLPWKDIPLKYMPRNHQEVEFLIQFFTSVDLPSFEKLHHVFHSNERFLVYQYYLYYEPVLMQGGFWTEPELYKVCMRHNDPKYILDIVQAAKDHMPEFSASWEPEFDYLYNKQWYPWMQYGPWAVRSSVIAMTVLVIVEIIWGPWITGG